MSVLFNSFGFLASFAALACVYYALPHRVRWVLLLGASLAFYAAFNVKYVPLLLGVSVVAYLGGQGIARQLDERKRRRTLIGSVIAVLAALFVFKYFDFVAASVDALLNAAGLGASEPVLPRMDLPAAAGLSFYTFSSLSYLADVYARRIEPERHFGYFIVYVAFFPKLLAGPIERAQPFLAQVRRPAAFSDGGVTLGLQLMLWGLFKKVVIADRLAPLVDAAYRQPALAPPSDLLLATYFFAFQLYCDFSGYSDIAIGAAKVLGFDLSENFRRPYFATSVSEFWARRWHLSLTSWFRDYVYIPLGGNRGSRVRHHMNVIAVFLLSGLWHGANWTFVVWGGMNGLYQVASAMTGGARARLAATLRLPPGIERLLRTALTFHLILVSWIFFRAESVADAVLIFSRVVASAGRLPALVVARLATAEMWLSLLLIVVLLVVESLDETRPLWERLRARPVYARWAAYYALVFALIVLGIWNLQQFVYMQF